MSTIIYIYSTSEPIWLSKMSVYIFKSVFSCASMFYVFMFYVSMLSGKMKRSVILV